MNRLRRSTLRALTRFYSEGGQGAFSSSSGKQVTPNPNVPGLSSAVVLPAEAPVGPNVDPKKTGAYKVPEYFCYDNMSFFEAEVEMQQFRLPQPSSIKK